MKKKEKSEIGGFTANSLIIPLAAFLTAVIVCITLLTMNIHWTTIDLTDLMQQTNEYQHLIKDLQGNVMQLSLISTDFIKEPLSETNELNIGPLGGYVAALKNSEQRGPIVADKFRKLGASDEVQECMDAVSVDSEQMRIIEGYALALMLSVYQTSAPHLKVLTQTALSPEDEALSEDERVKKARKLISNTSDYVGYRSNLTQNVNAITDILDAEFGVEAEEGKEHISTLRIALWAMIGVLIIAMGITFIAFYRWVVGPLRQYAQQISSDQVLKRRGAVRELRSLVLAHNDLLRRRNKLETILRTAAETDALTGLPNRYSLERYALEIDDDEAPLAVLLFDVNFLKKVNDTQGHLAGDQLLRTAALCIRESFSSGTLDNCYRFGGDEFAAVLRDCNEDDIKDRIERFNRNLEREKISVSVGYAYTDEIGEGRFKRLMALADKRMYAEKRNVHKREEMLDSNE